MKIINLLIGIVLILGAIIIMESFVVLPNTTDVTVLWDVTDSSIGKPSSDEIIRLYHLDGPSKWDGATFRYSTLSNVNFNHTEELILPIRNKWLSNELEREKEIKTFKSQIAYIIDTPRDSTSGKTNSSLFWPLFAHLKRLSEQNKELAGSFISKRIMVVQSDLMENNESLSLYDSKQLHAFSSDPASAKYLTDNLTQLQSLKGIEVYLLYKPKDAQDSQRYTLISEVVKNLLEEKGAKVYRSANLIR